MWKVAAYIPLAVRKLRPWKKVGLALPLEAGRSLGTLLSSARPYRSEMFSDLPK